jgi:outer membrane protein TolC
MKRFALVLALGLVAASHVIAQQQPVRLSLADALARADSASPAVGIARAGITGAQANWLRARAGYLPQLNGSATYSRALASEFSGLTAASAADTFAAPTNCRHYVPNPSLPLADRLDSIEHGLDCAANGPGVIDFSKLPFGRPNTWTFGLSGSQTLFDRKLGGLLDAADAGRDQATIEVDAQRAAAVLNVAQAYFDAQLAQRLVDIADSTLAQAQRTFEQTRLERQVGNAAEFDQLRAGVARDNQTPVVIQRRAQRDQALLRLRQVLDLPANTALTLTTALSDTNAVPLPAFAARISDDTTVAARAPVREAEAALRASEGQLRSSRAEHTPTLALSSTYSKIDFPVNVFSFDQFLTDWSVAVQMTVPIYNGGRTRADALAATAARDQSAMRLKQARQQAQLEQGDARTQLGSAEASFAASIGTIVQAQRAYDIAELRYQNGLSTLTDVGDARLQLGQAEANSAQAARDLQVARMRLALLRDLPFSGSASTAAPASTGSSTTTNPTANGARPIGTGTPTGSP